MCNEQGYKKLKYVVTLNSDQCDPSIKLFFFLSKISYPFFNQWHVEVPSRIISFSVYRYPLGASSVPSQPLHISVHHNISLSLSPHILCSPIQGLMTASVCCCVVMAAPGGTLSSAGVRDELRATRWASACN